VGALSIIALTLINVMANGLDIKIRMIKDFVKLVLKL
jgi:hypothetical protein